MKIAQLGSFGTTVWGGLIVITGVLALGILTWEAKEGARLKTAILITAVTALALTVLLVFVYLFDLQLNLVADVEAGTLEVIHGRRAGMRAKRSFSLGDITKTSVDDHGEDNVAAYLHLGKERIPIFPTRIGDDARKVIAFVEDALTSWRALTKSD